MLSIEYIECGLCIGCIYEKFIGNLDAVLGHNLIQMVAKQWSQVYDLQPGIFQVMFKTEHVKQGFR